MTRNMARNAVEHTSKALLGKVFPSLGKVSGWLARYDFASPVRPTSLPRAANLFPSFGQFIFP